MSTKIDSLSLYTNPPPKLARSNSNDSIVVFEPNQSQNHVDEITFSTNNENKSDKNKTTQILTGIGITAGTIGLGLVTKYFLKSNSNALSQIPKAIMKPKSFRTNERQCIKLEFLNKYVDDVPLNVDARIKAEYNPIKNPLDRIVYA